MAVTRSAKNPWMADVTQTMNPDGSQQMNISQNGESMQINRGADGNVTATQKKKVNTMDFLPFVSANPTATFIDEMFGTNISRAIPTQAQLIGQYRQLQDKEEDPMMDLRRRKMEAELRNLNREDPLKKLRMEKLQKEIEQIGKPKPLSPVDKANLELKAAQADEKEARKEQIKEKQATEYGKWIEKSGVEELTNNLREISALTAGVKDIPGFGQTQWVPDVLISEEGESLRASINELFNKVLKNRSGAAVTTAEMQRLKKEFETVKGKDDKALRRFLNKFKRRMLSKIKNIVASTPKGAREMYEASDVGTNWIKEIEALSFDAGDEPKAQLTEEDIMKELQQLEAGRTQ